MATDDLRFLQDRRTTQRERTHSMKHLLVALCGAIGLAASMAAFAPAGDGNPPGRDPCSHGATGKPCRPDPQPTHGKDCEHHGNGGVNEDHCAGTTSTTTTTTPHTTTTTPTTTSCGTCDHTTTTTRTTTVTSTTPSPPPTTVTTSAPPCNCPPASVVVNVTQQVIVQAPPATAVTVTASSTTASGALVLTITCPASSNPQTVYVVTSAGTIPVVVPAGQTSVTVVVPKGAHKPAVHKKKTVRKAPHKAAVKKSKRCLPGFRVFRGSCHRIIHGKG